MNLKAVMVAALLVGCSNDRQQSLVDSLQNENDALKAEVQTLRAEVAGLTAAAGEARDAAVAEAARNYARQCARALEIRRLDDPAMLVPTALNGKECDDPLLGDDAVGRMMGVERSRITVPADGSGYTVEVTDSTGVRHEQSSN